jgi:nicotinamide-nucleotide amidase
MDRDLIEAARALIELCRRKKLKVATAESCTGGLVAGTLTEVAGSSDVFERGFVTYSDEAKQAMLGVTPDTLARHGAVSRETARAMAAGAVAHAPVELAI